MKPRRIIHWLVLSTTAGIGISGVPAPAQTREPKPLEAPARGSPRLTGDDARRAGELESAVEAAQQAGQWDEAVAQAGELLALRTRVAGSEHFETVSAAWRVKTLRQVAAMKSGDRAAFQSARTINQQAMALSAQGKSAQAQPLYEKVLEIHRRLLSDDNPDTGDSYVNLAGSLNEQGKYALAQPLFEKALAIHRRLLTDLHPATANSYSSVAFNLNAQGLYAQAQPMFEKGLELFRRMLTENHPDTANAYNNVAMNLTSQGKYGQAEPVFQKALEIRRRVLTDDDSETATSYNNVAEVKSAQAKYAQAEPLYEKALEILRRLLTDDHPYTATAYHNLALNLQAQGKYAQARLLHEKALEIRRRLLTESHPDTARSYNNLAFVLAAGGNYVEAQALYEKALAIRRRVLTDQHPQTANSFNNVASNLGRQGKYSEAQPLLEKALEIRRSLLTDDHPDTAASFGALASNLTAQGRYSAAAPLHATALAKRRALLTDDHPHTAESYYSLGVNLSAEGKYEEARQQWVRSAKSQDSARLQVAFTGLERAGNTFSARPALAAVTARLGRAAEAWQVLEEDLGRGLLDELAARQDSRLAPGERGRLRELTAALEALDRLMETTPRNLDQAEHTRQFEALKRKRELASIALGEFHTKLVNEHGPLAGKVVTLREIQSGLSPDAALVAWVDLPPAGPGAADPGGEHWGVVVRARGIPSWARLSGTGQGGCWTSDDTALAAQVRTGLRSRQSARTTMPQPLFERLRAQRLDPLASALGATADGLPTVRRLIVLSSRALAGIPIEALLAADDSRTISYAPSATVFKYLREQPRPDRHAGLLALGDPIYEQPEKSSGARPLPDRGLLLKFVIPGANAASHGLKPGDVLLAYNGSPLKKREDLKIVAAGDRPVAVEVWRDGQSSRRELAPGKLGVVIDPRPAPVAIAEERRLDQVLVAARSGGETFDSLPGTRYEVEAIARLFTVDDRPTRLLLGADASEPELDKIASSGDLGHFGFIHLATHGVIDEDVPARSAVILTQTGLPDPLEQVLRQKPAFDGRLSVREIQRGWELKAELVTLSACETALGRDLGGEGFVGFTQALLMSGARSVCLSLWKVDDTATALLMIRFYQNLLGRRSGLAGPMPKAEALREAKAWLRGLRRAEVVALAAALSGGIERSKGASARRPAELGAAAPAGDDSDQPYASPHYWAAFVLVGDPD